jgi:hypothetical protein
MWHTVRLTRHTEQLMVYQERVDTPAEEIMTEYGPAGCTWLRPASDLRNSGRYLHARREAITDESAWVLPVCLCD